MNKGKEISYLLSYISVEKNNNGGEQFNHQAGGGDFDIFYNKQRNSKFMESISKSLDYIDEYHPDSIKKLEIFSKDGDIYICQSKENEIILDFIKRLGRKWV